VEQGPNATSNVSQGIGAIDYVLSDRDRLTGKYYIQTDPTTNPFGAVGALLGFGQQMQSGSQVGSINNTTILSPNLTWSQRIGLTRLKAFAQTGQDFTPGQMGMNLLGATGFPQITISSFDTTLANSLEFGPSQSFSNAGMVQNQGELGTALNWVKGPHTLSFGGLWDSTQLNVINNDTNVDGIGFSSLTNFVEGNVRTGKYTTAFSGAASRYYRSNTVGTYVNDNWKISKGR
jgi:hypothetical protein